VGNLTPYRGKRALVCGRRDYDDRETVDWRLDALNPTVMIEGNATGADTLARAWWLRNRTDWPRSFPPRSEDIQRWGYARALTMRNARMLAEGRPDYVLAFPGGRGTEDMVSKAKAAGVHVLRVRRDGSVEVDDA
jgi:hypothetical protein